MARDTALEKGIIINGLPIMNDRPNPFGFPNETDLDRAKRSDFSHNQTQRDNQHAFSMPFSPESWPFTARLERPSQRESPMFSGKIGRGERI